MHLSVLYQNQEESIQNNFFDFTCSRNICSCFSKVSITKAHQSQRNQVKWLVINLQVQAHNIIRKNAWATMVYYTRKEILEALIDPLTNMDNIAQTRTASVAHLCKSARIKLLCRNSTSTHLFFSSIIVPLSPLQIPQYCLIFSVDIRVSPHQYVVLLTCGVSTTEP